MAPSLKSKMFFFCYQVVKSVGDNVVTLSVCVCYGHPHTHTHSHMRAESSRPRSLYLPPLLFLPPPLSPLLFDKARKQTWKERGMRERKSISRATQGKFAQRYSCFFFLQKAHRKLLVLYFSPS